MTTTKTTKKAAPKKPVKKTSASKPRSKKEAPAAPVATAQATPAATPVYQWTNNSSEVLILRFADREGKAYQGFQHPMEVGQAVTAPDWNAAPVCGGGIHGWPWGIGIGDGKEPDWSALWQVYGVDPADIVGEIETGAKCKFRTGTLRYKGDWHGATNFILSGQMNWAFHASRGAASNSGDRGAASNSGDRGAASNSGYRGAALSSGEYSSAETTAPGTPAIVSGLNSRARAAEFGCIALSWWNEKERRSEMRCALVGSGEGTLNPNIWYRLDDAGNFVEAQ